MYGTQAVTMPMFCTSWLHRTTGQRRYVKSAVPDARWRYTSWAMADAMTLERMMIQEMKENDDAMRNLVGLQGTCSKATSDAELALLVHLKFPDDSEWQQCESCVGNDIENTEIRPESILHPVRNDEDVGQLRYQWSYLIDTFIVNQPPRFRCAALEGSDEFRGW